jgi:geranylgeranyl pyrophosphate synthase
MSSDDVKRIIQHSLEGAGIPAPFARLLEIPLRQPGRAYSDTEPSRWEAFIRACCDATGGDERLVATIAASFELCISALDVLDEIEDNDVSPLVEAVGTPRSINVSTALLTAAQSLMLAIPAGNSTSNTSADFAGALNRAVLAATAGQDRDLEPTAHGGDSLDRSLSIARDKSGSLVAGAAVLGAMTGTSDEAILARYSELGTHFGAMAQIANDIHDAVDPTQKSDARVMKPTLPILFASRAEADEGARLQNDQIVRSGALHFGWVVFETERRKCVEIIDELAQLGHLVEPLYAMLGKLGS